MREPTPENAQIIRMASNQKSETGDVKNQTRCLVCDGTLDRSHLLGLLQCGACGFITADLRLSDEEHKALYGPDYFHGDEYADYLLEEAGLKENFRQRLATLLHYAGDPSAKTLFEIGCAYGFFLDVARERFAAVAGIDIAEHCVTHARDSLGLDVTVGDFVSHKHDRPYDVYCMWDAIEHLKNPADFVAKITENIQPGGLLAITTGDIGSLNARFRGRRWRLIHPPTHLHYFSKRTLTRLCNRYGFEIVHIEYPGIVRSVRFILYSILVLRYRRVGLFRRLENMGFLDRKVSINLFDIMYVIARKRAD